MAGDRIENNVSFGDFMSDPGEAVQRIWEELFPGPQKTITEKDFKLDEKSKPVAPNITTVESKFGIKQDPESRYDMTRDPGSIDEFFTVDHSGDGQITIPELDYESQRRHRRSYEGDHKIDYELYKVRGNFEQIAGPDGQLSREDLQAYRDQRAALPPILRAIDSDGSLSADSEEISRRINFPRENDDFYIYNVLAQARDNFAAIAHRDGEISGQEWSEFFNARQAQ